jgi:hypothetical protein
MPHIAVRTTFRHARHHRQDWLLAIPGPTRTPPRLKCIRGHPRPTG